MDSVRTLWHNELLKNATSIAYHSTNVYIKHAAMKASSTCLVDMKKNVATSDIKKELLAKSSAELLFPATQEVATSTPTRDSFIETIPLLYSGFALHVEKATVLYCCREVSELVPFSSKLQRN